MAQHTIPATHSPNTINFHQKSLDFSQVQLTRVNRRHHCTKGHIFLMTWMIAYCYYLLCNKITFVLRDLMVTMLQTEVPCKSNYLIYKATYEQIISVNVLLLIAPNIYTLQLIPKQAQFQNTQTTKTTTARVQAAAGLGTEASSWRAGSSSSLPGAVMQ